MDPAPWTAQAIAEAVAVFAVAAIIAVLIGRIAYHVMAKHG